MNKMNIMTVEEKSERYIKNGWGELNVGGWRARMKESFVAGHKEAMRWRDPKEELPELLPGCDYSNNVLAQVEGFTETQVMCLVFIPDDEGGWGYVWANCYGDINGEAEWDDDYKVIGWRPIE